MKVILLEDVKKLGFRNEVVETSLGYANNFLLKNKKAVLATDANLKKLHSLINEKDKKREEEIAKAKIQKAKIEKKTFEFQLKLGSNGNVFGKISTKQVFQKLNDEGFEIDRKKIKTTGINHLGEETICVELDKEVIANIKINIIGV